jgi:hypothetical protein
MSRRVYSLGLALLLGWQGIAAADDAARRDPLLQALVDELQRVPQLAVPGAQAPYYVALRIADSHVFEVEASFGALVANQAFPDRRLFADVRVGSYEHDNGNFEADRAWSEYADQSHRWLPFEDDYAAVRRDAWLATDAGYKAALRALGQKSAVQTREQTSLDRAASFSREPTIQTIDARAVSPVDRSRFEKLVKDLSAVGRGSAHLHSAVATVSGATGRRLFVSTEGSRVIEPRARLQLNVVLRAQADDGMHLAHFLVLGACKAERLPVDGVLQAEVQRIKQQLEQTRQAPVAEDYTGPVLFEGIAAPQLLSELLASELSGTPPEQSADGAPSRPDSQLSSQLGQRILPSGYTLIDDPTIDHLEQTPLAGCYSIDDEGVTAQKVTLVEDGIFKAFVMSRTPREGFDHSNGHGRESYDGARARIANLILSSNSGVSSLELRKRLIKAARAANKPYGLIVRVLDYPAFTRERRNDWFPGGGDDDQRVLVLSKLTLDGQEQPVRGATLGPIELGSLKRLLAAGNTPSVFSSYSDSVASPALLFDDVTIKKSAGPLQKPPLLPRPDLSSSP